MPKYTKQQLEAQYEKLPDVLKDAIFSVEIAEHMFELGKKHGLTMEKTGFAAEETGFVILGLLPPREFASSLASRLEIDTEKAVALASDINHQIFFPLREALKDTHHIEVGEGAIRADSPLPRRTSGALISEITPPAAVPPPMPPPIPTRQNPPVATSAGGAPPAPKPAQKPEIPVPMPQAPQTPPSFVPPTPAPPKPAVITLAPLTPATTIQNQGSKDAEKKTPAPAPIKLTPLAPTPIQSQSASQSLGASSPNPAPAPSQNPVMDRLPETQKPPEPKKPSPIILRQKIAEDLQKEIAPLIGRVPDPISPMPAGFLTRQETEKIIAEKRAHQKPISSQEPPPKTDPTPPPPSPTPIKLEPLPPTSSAPIPPPAPPLGTAKVPALDLRGVPKPPPKTYDDFDPYKEPIE